MPPFTLLQTTCLLGSADEKLGTICVGSSICHGQDARTHMLQGEILIIKLLPKDGLSTCAIMACEVTILAHKSQNKFCESWNLYNQILSPQCSEQERFLLSLKLCLQTAQKRHMAQGLAVDNNVEEHGGVDVVARGGLRGGGVWKACLLFF